MASKVLVKIPVAPFGHVNKGKSSSSSSTTGSANDVSSGAPTTSVTAEIVTVGTSRCTDPLLRIAQLEQNIRFLQDQHSQMLAGLHQEIDTLRQRNRDLQFQLVFSKGQIATSNSASPTSSPEDDSKNRVLSPKQVNVTPLQVELLERELGELKITLNEVNTKNAYLTAIVDEQKKKLERLNQDQNSSLAAPDPELLSKLDDVESLVRKLRRENDDLRREVTDIRSQPQQSNNGPNLQYNNGGGGPQQQQQHRGGRHRGGHYRGHRFPPLHTQSYWQGGRTQEKDDGINPSTSLPSLSMNGGGPPQQPQMHHQHSTGGVPHHGGHGGHYSGGKRSGGNNHNNHQYHQGGNGNTGKYRGSQPRGHKS